MGNPAIQYGEYTFVYFIKEKHIKMYMGGAQMRPTNWVPAEAYFVVAQWIAAVDISLEKEQVAEEKAPEPAVEKAVSKKETADNQEKIISFPGKKKE